MEFDWSKDYESRQPELSLIFFSNGRMANVSVCEACGGVWFCGENSFIYRKQDDLLKTFGVKLIPIKEEYLYNNGKLINILEKQEKITGICFEVPCSYIGERNPFEVFSDELDNYSKIINNLRSKKIISYIDGARIITFSMIYNFDLEKPDIVCYGLDKSLPRKYFGAVVQANDNRLKRIIKNSRNLIGGYIRGGGILDNILDEIGKNVESNVKSNYAILQQFKKELCKKVDLLDTGGNCLAFSTDLVGSLEIEKQLRGKCLQEGKTFILYFNLSITGTEFLIQLDYLRKVLIKNV